MGTLYAGEISPIVGVYALPGSGYLELRALYKYLRPYGGVPHPDDLLVQVRRIVVRATIGRFRFFFLHLEQGTVQALFSSRG